MPPLQMHQENALQFRSFVPTLMELLEDADGMVRDNARNTVIELFQYVDSHCIFP
jgi:CLIP-associating protein 1/2